MILIDPVVAAGMIVICSAIIGAIAAGALFVIAAEAVAEWKEDREWKRAQRRAA